MRNEKLSAYSLHHKAYQDKRSLYYLFTKELGIIHGVGKRGTPQFVPLTLFASGKRSLKTLQQITASQMVEALIGQQQYAALYVNEIVLNLLPTEDPVPELFDKYADTITYLRQPLEPNQLRHILRSFEKELFEQIGYGLDFYQDATGQLIKSDANYQYIKGEGWHRMDNPILDNPLLDNPLLDNPVETSPPSKDSDTSLLIQTKGRHITKDAITGSTIISMQQGINTDNLTLFTILHKQLIDQLFDYKPLQSRILWQQFMQYQ